MGDGVDGGEFEGLLDAAQPRHGLEPNRGSLHEHLKSKSNFTAIAS